MSIKVGDKVKVKPFSDVGVVEAERQMGRVLVRFERGGNPVIVEKDKCEIVNSVAASTETARLYQMGLEDGRRGKKDHGMNPNIAPEYFRGFEAGTKERGKTTNTFDRGRQRAHAAIQNKLEQVGIGLANAATIKAIAYKENGKEVVKPVSNDAEANRLTAELDKKGIEWMAQYTSGWQNAKTCNASEQYVSLGGKSYRKSGSGSWSNKSDGGSVKDADLIARLEARLIELSKMYNNQKTTNAETVIFSESGYKIAVTIGDTSGGCVLHTPDGQRIPHNSATDARKDLVRLMKDAGVYGSATKVGNSIPYKAHELPVGSRVVYNDRYGTITANDGSKVTVKYDAAKDGSDTETVPLSATGNMKRK